MWREVAVHRHCKPDGMETRVPAKVLKHKEGLRASSDVPVSIVMSVSPGLLLVCWKEVYHARCLFPVTYKVG